MPIQQNIKITVDAVVFGYDKQSGLSVLFIKRKLEPFKGSWALPGGFILKNESLEEAVERELREETGISVNYLEQLYTFGQPKRDPRSHIITVAYFALVKQANFQLHASTDASDAQWFSIKKLPTLAFDHAQILNLAHERLRSKLQYQPIGFELLDTSFPFGDLERLYSSVLNRPIDRRNFKKKIMRFGILKKLDTKVQNGPGRPGFLYEFNKEQYFELTKKGFVFEV